MSFVRSFYRVNSSLFRNYYSVNIVKQNVAFYSVKKQHRRPIKFFKPDGETEMDFEGTPGRKVVPDHRNDEIQGVIELNKDFSHRVNLEKFQKDNVVESGKTDDENDESGEIVGTTFTRLGNLDRLFDRRMLNIQSKKMRNKSNMIMLEGKRLIQEAISAGVIPDEIFFTKKTLVEDLLMPPGVVKLYKMPYNLMKKWSPLQTPPGIIAFCKLPKNLQRPKPKDAVPVTLICDNVREPGNMGTILRTVAGVGCLKVLFTKGCVDVWDPKVLRGAAGAHFYVSMENDLTWEDINEDLTEKSKIFIADHNDNERIFSKHAIPTIPYYGIDYSNLSDIVIIVGGETEGISVDALSLARYRDGLKIKIPLSSQIDSLNVGAAISTILFEIRRQFIINNGDPVRYDNDVKNISDTTVSVNENIVVN